MAATESNLQALWKRSANIMPPTTAQMMPDRKLSVMEFDGKINSGDAPKFQVGTEFLHCGLQNLDLCSCRLVNCGILDCNLFHGRLKHCNVQTSRLHKSTIKSKFREAPYERRPERVAARIESRTRSSDLYYCDLVFTLVSRGS